MEYSLVAIIVLIIGIIIGGRLQRHSFFPFASYSPLLIFFLHRLAIPRPGLGFVGHGRHATRDKLGPDRARDRNILLFRAQRRS